MIEDRRLILLLALFVLSAAVSAWRCRVVVFPLWTRGRRRQSELRSGDVLLWSRQLLQSDVAKFVCGTPYTHVSMVFVDAATKVFHFEVRSSQVSRMRVLRVDDSREDCVVRQLTPPLARPGELEAIITRMSGKPYRDSWWRAVLQSWCGYMHVPAAIAGDGSYFCSQLVADAYSALGVLDYTHFSKPSSMAMPADFSEGNEHLPFTRGYAFGHEEHLATDV